MGFTVVGANHFLGSGHPGSIEDDPPFLGLIESRNAGTTWRPLSLRGKVDFHVLETRGKAVYGFGSDWDSREARFLRGDDRGRSWMRLAAPEELFGLATDPEEPRVSVALGEQRGWLSRDSESSWQPLSVPGGMVTWSEELGVVAADFKGFIRSTGDPTGRVGRGRAAPRSAGCAGSCGRRAACRHSRLAGSVVARRRQDVARASRALETSHPARSSSSRPDRGRAGGADRDVDARRAGGDALAAAAGRGHRQRGVLAGRRHGERRGPRDSAGARSDRHRPESVRRQLEPAQRSEDLGLSACASVVPAGGTVLEIEARPAPATSSPRGWHGPPDSLTRRVRAGLRKVRSRTPARRTALEKLDEFEVKLGQLQVSGAISVEDATRLTGRADDAIACIESLSTSTATPAV